MNSPAGVMACAMALPLSLAAQEPASQVEPPAKSLGMVVISGGQATSLPTQIPTTIEGMSRQQLDEAVNAIDSEDALKYLPSLLVRKRYAGDYNHAVLSSRASGTGNSARSMVYADGILLSNFLGNGASYAPRWGMVSPEEIERVDVMYGPFSAAYPGNSVGAVVDYVTRMPTQFEGHAQATVHSQRFSLYNSDGVYGGRQASASLGNRQGDWSWRLHLNQSDNEGQPLVFATRLLSATSGAGTTPVTGAVQTPNNFGVANYVLGTNTQYHTVQNQVRLKLAYDVSPNLRASYSLGYWGNLSDGNPQTYLRDAAGRPVYFGAVRINGQNYSANGLFNQSRENLAHLVHSVSLKRHTQGVWDWELAASAYDYGRDLQRAATLSDAASTTANPTTTRLTGGPGTLTDQKGTGWTTLAFKATWRPQGWQGTHIVDWGWQQERYQLRILKSGIQGNWLSDEAGTTLSNVGGTTQLQSLYAQDTWRLAARWKAVLGLRVEQWSAMGGYTRLLGSTPVDYGSRIETHVSPKAALSHQWSPTTVLKASLGRAVRMPTVQELYGATSNANLSFVNDPNLQPEKSWTAELSLERDLGNAFLRLTAFQEDVRDSLYTQPIAGTTSSRVQNVDAIRTQGLEAALQGQDVGLRGLDLSGSITYADSRIVSNPVLPASEGKYQPRVPVWRATALVTYRWHAQRSATLGVRYSGDQYSQLDNSDVNGFAYQGASRYLIADRRLRWRVQQRTVLALGIDNLGNEEYWNFHPYPKRSYVAELKHDF